MYKIVAFVFSWTNDTKINRKNKTMENERIPLNVELTNEERNICDASYSEIVLYYIFNPKQLVISLYESIMSTLRYLF